MIGLLAVLALAGAAGGVGVRAFQTMGEARESAVRQVASLRAQRDAAERRARDAVAECARVRSFSLAGATLSGDVGVTGRTAPRDAEELVRLVRGLALVDDVILGDGAGYALSHETSAGSAALAALAPHAERLVDAMRAVGFATTQLEVETFQADRVVLRALAGRGAGAWLAVRTTSYPVNQLVLDAVAFAAARESSIEAPRTSVVASLPRTEVLVAPAAGAASALRPAIERALGVDHRAIVMLEDRTAIVSASLEGPSELCRGAAAEALAVAAIAAERTLRESAVARVEVLVDDGSRVTWSSFGPQSRFALVTFTDPGVGSNSRLDRLVGTLRRGLELRAPTRDLDAVRT